MENIKIFGIYNDTINYVRKNSIVKRISQNLSQCASSVLYYLHKIFFKKIRRGFYISLQTKRHKLSSDAISETDAPIYLFMKF